MEDHTKEVNMLRIRLGTGAPLIICTLKGGTFAEARVADAETGLCEIAPVAAAGIFLDAERCYITHPADALALARWIEDAASWLAMENGYDDFFEEDEDEEYSEGYGEDEDGFYFEDDDEYEDDEL